jgi:hypothetical protein
MLLTDKKKFYWLGISLIILCYVLAWLSSYLDRDLPKGSFSNASIAVMTLSFTTSFLGSFYVIKAKGRSWRFIALALLSLIGHLLIIFVLPDKNVRKDSREQV